MLSHFFIDRPVFASVISIIILIAGGVALFGLPIAQYPEITPPQIQVAATYPGANADVVSQNVASPIEQQVNGADDMIYMYSTSSSSGGMTLNVFFDIDRDPDLAQVDVQNRVNLALPKLPQAVSAQGVQIKKVSATFLMVVAVYASDDRHDPTYVGNYTNLYVLDAIKRIPGANQAAILAIPDYAMRLWVKPDRMAQLGITTVNHLGYDTFVSRVFHKKSIIVLGLHPLSIDKHGPPSFNSCSNSNYRVIYLFPFQKNNDIVTQTHRKA